MGPGEGSTSSPARRSRPSSGLGVRSRIGSEERAKEMHEAPKAALADVATQTLSLAPLAINYNFAPNAVEQRPHPIASVKPPQPQTPSQPKQRTTSFSESESDQSPARKSKRLSRRQREREEELRRNIRREIEEELKAASEPAPAGLIPETQARYPSRALTNEELNAVTSSEDFLDFVDRSSKVIEKALDQDYDVLTDYALNGETYNEEEDEGYASSKGRRGRRIKEIAQFYDERWSKKRMISDLGFSSKVGLHSTRANKLIKAPSILNSFWPHTLRIHLLHKILLVSSRYGTCISTHGPNTPSMRHLIFLQLSFRHSIPPSSWEAHIADKSCSGTHAQKRRFLSRKHL